MLFVKRKALANEKIQWVHPTTGDTLQGTVLSIKENSVIVEIDNYGPNLYDVFLNERTVVKHTRYHVMVQRST